MTTTRRTFLKTSALGGAGLLIPAPYPFASASPNEKLDIGVVGVGGRGGANLAAVAGENVVALCDVDERVLAGAAQRFPQARTYRDFRRMLDAERLDALVVSTPDHTHAVAAMAGIRRDLHVYCEKPLAHSVAEVRVLTDEARRRGLVTQMGTQIHAGGNYRRVVELVRAGAIGSVTDVHVWCNKSWSGGGRPEEGAPVPEHLDWDLWLGPAAERPYSAAYQPANWRRYWDFGGGTLSDMACHYMDLPFWALDLAHPTSVEAEGPPVHGYTTPRWLVARWRFPARGERPPVTLTWYDGGRRPGMLAALGAANWANGVLFLGDHGGLVADYGHYALLPEQNFVDFQPPEPTIPDSSGHHAEWIEACKTGGATTCGFDYSGPLSETVILGNVAYRAGAKLAWDAESLAARGSDAAKALLYDAYRGGWSL